MHEKAVTRHKVRAALMLLSAVLTLLACEPEPAPPPAPKPRVVPGCPSGKSLDPPKAELRPAIDAFHAQNYAEAQRTLDALTTKYPASATVRVWRGDATLFDKALPESDAAERALPYFVAGKRLHDAGCRLPEYEHYYMRMGLAYGYMRRDDPKPALQELETARQHWPDSAEVTYQIARAHCALGQVEICAEDFETTLQIARSLKRPLFLRTHNSVDDWIRRSRTQSEFPELRKTARYQRSVAEATSGR
jgi:tetratricopeptide (TPR) repeat protein